MTKSNKQVLLKPDKTALTYKNVLDTYLELPIKATYFETGCVAEMQSESFRIYTGYDG